MVDILLQLIIYSFLGGAVRVSIALLEEESG